MAWTAFMDCLEEILGQDWQSIVEVRPSWSKWQSMEELRENVPEQQLVELARELGLLSKSEMKTILGLLAKRNECAHPTGHEPDMNQAIGYIAELLSRVEKLARKRV